MLLVFHNFFTRNKRLQQHTVRIVVLNLIVLFSTITGVILPYPVVFDAQIKTPPFKRQGLLTKIHDTIHQIGNEQIHYKKATVQVLSAQAAVPSRIGDWGVAKQISEHTWTMQVENDQAVGTAQEILQALNNYRNQHGSGSLSWDAGLSSFAKQRSDLFQNKGSMDSHAGFTDFINNQDGFHKLGFMALGENSSFGYHVLAVHLIEWIYAGDAPHNNNQLNPEWTYVGIGVTGLATDLVFGGRKM